MNPSLKRQLLRTFAQMIRDLKNTKEVEIFLSDFFSESELETNIKRLAIAYWLKKGRDKENIKTNLKATSNEILLVEKQVQKHGFKLAIKYVEAEEWANLWAEKIKKVIK
jgi:uncharacterized protein YerC